MKEGVLSRESAGPAAKRDTNEIPTRERKRTAHDQERQEQDERPEQSTHTKERPR